jgi:hypothetical protein
VSIAAVDINRGRFKRSSFDAGIFMSEFSSRRQLIHAFGAINPQMTFKRQG